MPLLVFKSSDGNRQMVEAAVGSTVMASAQKSGVKIEGACEGSMLCSTCHVIVDKEWLARLEPASDEEADLLDLAVGLTPTSRLGCQIVITEALNGLEVTLPYETDNLTEF
mgnify:FL=1